MWAWLIRRFIARACVPSREYRKGHLYHGDGSLYMGRWALFESRWLSARVHHIASEDYDRAMHDHPWAFVSLVLSGGYVELRPMCPDDPSWVRMGDLWRERWVGRWRGPGTLAFRRPTDRHVVKDVQPGTYTLFIYGPARHWWGFYTRTGKIHWQDFNAEITASIKVREEVQ